jgi:hypothetical protein
LIDGMAAHSTSVHSGGVTQGDSLPVQPPQHPLMRNAGVREDVSDHDEAVRSVEAPTRILSVHPDFAPTVRRRRGDRMTQQAGADAVSPVSAQHRRRVPTGSSSGVNASQ